MFITPVMMEKAQANIVKHSWAAGVQRQLVEDAQPWLSFSDDELWKLMFGNTVTRSWMVWSNGYCPACGGNVTMYEWEIDALKMPWKTRCPHCKTVFPKNNFYDFYRSGLDEHGVFNPRLADRSLLFNLEHPDPEDPLHMFGVDDGEGYVENGKRWRFIGAYLIYGQWKQLVYGGIRKLSAAYAVTGDPRYARKAGILLDRVADLYPTFDYAKQGLTYENPGSAGYVSVWHDACEETRELALAYDLVREALRRDRSLVIFLSAKAEEYHVSSPKASSEDILWNIEEHILREAVRNRQKIHSNYPRPDITIATIQTVLAWPHNRAEVIAILDEMLEKATAVDGVTGEKGLAGYSSYVVQGIAMLLEQFSRLDPDFLRNMFKRHPRLHATYRFHIDTWCLGKYYPQSGDTGGFGSPTPQYAAAGFTKSPGLSPSMYTFLWRLYELTGDEAFVQVLYHANGYSVEGLPYDLFADDFEAFQRRVQNVIARMGSVIHLGSVNKQEWRIAILRSGECVNARAVWLDYDSGGGHGHMDGMNLGLFAKGLDLMPDFGYPQVQYGGWRTPKALWYRMTAAHNTVVVDGKNQQQGAGVTTLWADGAQFHAVRASAPRLVEGKQYERTVVAVDVSDRDFYILDVFRVVGGFDHAKFMYSHFGKIATHGLRLIPTDGYGYETQTRGFQYDPAPEPGWSADWTIEDRYGLREPGSEIHLRYTDLTSKAQAFTCEAWIAGRGLYLKEEVWIPCVMVRRRLEEAPLASTFVGVIEPYEVQSCISEIHRLPLEATTGEAYPDASVAVEVQFTDGRSDLIVTADAENPLGLISSKYQGEYMVERKWDVHVKGELCLIRRSEGGEVERIVVCHGTSLRIGDLALELTEEADFIEIGFQEGHPVGVSGELEKIRGVTRGGVNLWKKELG